MRYLRFNMFCFTVIAGAGLYLLKGMVEERREYLASLQNEYVADQKTIKILKAEWTYLNSPDYLRELTSRYLDLKPIASNEVALAIDAIPYQMEKPHSVTFAYQTPSAKKSATHTPVISQSSERAKKP